MLFLNFGVTKFYIAKMPGKVLRRSSLSLHHRLLYNFTLQKYLKDNMAKYPIMSFVLLFFRYLNDNLLEAITNEWFYQKDKLRYL